MNNRLLTLLLITFMFTGTAFGQERKDKFAGVLELKDYEGSNYRTFELVSDLTYIDPRGREWYAQHGLITDGASIPQFLWSVIGSPYTGIYRRAAIIHDYYCTNNYKEWHSVENAFYDAMITDGVSKPKALLMYHAVVRFGPRWSLKEIKTCPDNTLCAKPGDLEVFLIKRQHRTEDEERLKQEMQSTAAEIEKKPDADLTYVFKMAEDRQPLHSIDEIRNRSDNWADARWRDDEPKDETYLKFDPKALQKLP